MYLFNEPCYDLDELAQTNLHIHTAYFSNCAKADMLLPDILREARRVGIKLIALTDHFNSPDFDVPGHNAFLADIASRCDIGDLKIIYGAELSAYGVGKYLDPLGLNKTLDYRLYAYNHFKMEYWEHPAERSPRGYIDHSLAVLAGLCRSGRADCIAHPFIGRNILCLEDKLAVTRGMTDSELGDILALGRDNAVAWELNVTAIPYDPDFSRRYFNLGRELGVMFNFGTDAHRLAGIPTRQFLDGIKAVLD